MKIVSSEVGIGSSSIYPKTLPQSFKSSLLSDHIVKDILDKWQKNSMLIPFISKVTINISVGAAQDRLDKAGALLERLTNRKPSIRKAKKTIKSFGISKKQPIAVVVTLRGVDAYKFLRDALMAVNNMLNEKNFDSNGNVAFGLKEHLLLPGARYDPGIGIFGMDIAITIERKGYRVIRRRIKRRSIPRRHRVTREEGILLMELLFGIRIVKS